MILNQMTNINDLKLLVINLKDDDSRRELAKKELEKFPVNYSFVEAINGRDQNLSVAVYPEKKVKRLTGYSLTRNELGCFMSHQKCWNIAVESNLPCLILEDDFKLSDSFYEAVSFAFKNYDQWELLRLQALAPNNKTANHVIGEKFAIASILGDPLGATAYLVKPSSAFKLINKSKQIYEPLDHYLEHFSKHDIEMRALLPYPVESSGAESTIPNRPYDERSLRGVRKFKRSIFRFLDRKFSSNPWFPK